MAEDTCAPNITEQDAIDTLGELEPGVDHSGLKGKALIAGNKKQHTYLPRKR